MRSFQAEITILPWPRVFADFQPTVGLHMFHWPSAHNTTLWTKAPELKSLMQSVPGKASVGVAFVGVAFVVFCPLCTWKVGVSNPTTR